MQGSLNWVTSGRKSRAFGIKRMRSKKRNPKCFLSKDAYKCSGQKASYNRNSLRWGYAKGSGTTITEKLKAPSHPYNHYVFRVPTGNIKGSVYVPRYY